MSHWLSARLSDNPDGTYDLRVEEWDLPARKYPEHVFSARVDPVYVESAGGLLAAFALLLGRADREVVRRGQPDQSG